MINDVSIVGITPLDYYKDKCSIKNCKQNIKSIELCVPCKKPDMESVNEIKVSFCVNGYKTLNTILGLKLLIDITCNIKVIYTALNEEQSLHSAHWSINFCDFILLKNICHDKFNICDSNIFIGLEDVYVSNFDDRSIDLSLLYIICNNSNHTNSCSDCNSKCSCIKKCDCNKGNNIFTPDLIPNNSYNTYYCPVQYYDTSSDIDKI